MIPAHRTAVRAETIVSVAINALVPTAIIALLGVSPPTALTGAHPLLPGLLMASGLATLLMTLVVTHLVRGRVRAAKVPPRARATLPGAVRALPAAVVPRAMAMALVAMLVLVPVWSAAVTLLGLLPLTAAGFVAFNLALGTSVGLTMTPAVVLRALADPA